MAEPNRLDAELGLTDNPIERQVRRAWEDAAAAEHGLRSEIEKLLK